MRGSPGEAKWSWKQVTALRQPALHEEKFAALLTCTSIASVLWLDAVWTDDNIWKPPDKFL